MINKNEADGDAAECLSDSLISPFSEERLSTARFCWRLCRAAPQPSTPWKMEFGERKRKRKSRSFKLVTDEGRMIH